MTNADSVGDQLVEGDNLWPYAVVGLGTEGRRWAEMCHLLQEKMPIYNLLQLPALNPEDIAIVFLFADLKDVEVTAQWPEVERQIVRLGATVFFFVPHIRPGFVFRDATGLVTAIFVDDASIDGFPLAVRFVCEIAHMAAEVEPVCVDVSDISCVVRGADRGTLMFVQSSGVNRAHVAVSRALQELADDESGSIEGVLVRLAAKDFTIENVAEGYQAIESVLGGTTCVVGMNANEELPGSVLYAFILAVRHAAPPAVTGAFRR